MLNHLSLFSGYEGFGLGLRLAGLPIRTVGYLEIDDYCQRVLQVRMADGVLDHAPIIRDITACDFRPMAGLVDIITAGFPCQPHSVAGARAGVADPRNLWPDTARCVGEVGPDYVLLENVPGILANGYGGIVIGQLAEMGYRVRWGVVSAAKVGAPHLRKRWWCLAYSDGSRRPEPRDACRSANAGRSAIGHQQADVRSGPINVCCQMADPGGAGCEGRRNGAEPVEPPHAGPVHPGAAQLADATGIRWPQLATPRQPLRSDGTLADAESIGWSQGWQPNERQSTCGSEKTTGSWWQVEPPLGRVVDGCPDRVASIRALGNGIVPAVVAEFLKMIAP